MAARFLRVVAIVAITVYAAGVVLLAVGVTVPLGTFSDPASGWPIAIELVAAVLALFCWWWPTRHRGRATAIVVLAVGTISAFTLGAASYGSCPPRALSPWATVSDVLGLMLNSYDTSMFGQPGCAAEPPAALQFARLLVVLLLFIAASRAVAALLRGQVDRIVVRFAPRLAVVVGVDAESAPILPTLARLRGGATRVAFTPDPGVPWSRTARAAGWRIVIADPADPAAIRALLRRGRRRKLESLAVLPSDSTEAQRLMRSVEHALRDTSANRPARVLLRIDDAWQAEDWRRRYLGRTGEWIVDTISAEEVTARLLLDAIQRGGADRIVLAGRGGIGFALLAELAQRSRERSVLGQDAAAPAVVVLDPRAQELIDQFAFGQRRFGNTVPIELTAHAAEVDRPALEKAAAGSAMPAMVLSEAGDDDRLRLAEMTGAAHPDWPVFSRVAGVSGIGAEPLLAHVVAYGPTLVGGPLDSWERLARLGHERYVQANPDPTIVSRRPWDELPGFYRESNARQIVTTLEAAVHAGRSWGASDATPVTPPSDAQLGSMAQEEHESWRAHHLLHGWRVGPRDDRRRRHPDLVPWSALPDAARRKTIDGVRSSLELLATLGYRSFDDPAAWRPLERRGEVTARRRDRAWTWSLSDGTRMRAQAGDWEVREGDSTPWSVAPEQFAAGYELVSGDRYRRLGTVEGRPARDGEVVSTLEGPVTAGRGSWVLRGSTGEQWVVRADHLARNYGEPLAP